MLGELKEAPALTWWGEVITIGDRIQLDIADAKDIVYYEKVGFGANAEWANSAIIDTEKGPVIIDEGARIDDFVKIVGPCYIGANTIIGTGAKITGAHIGDGCLVGMGGEVKNSIMEDGASIGPYSYLSDSIMRRKAFFGALVRTSNYRLDGKTVSVHNADGVLTDTGMRKLGCEVGEEANLGVGCVILPGRVVPAKSIFGPGVHVVKNLQPGRYMVKQELSFQPL